jgi:hypothetical protein
MSRQEIRIVAAALVLIAMVAVTELAHGQSSIAAVEASVSAEHIRVQDKFISDDLF